MVTSRNLTSPANTFSSDLLPALLARIRDFASAPQNGRTSTDDEALRTDIAQALRQWSQSPADRATTQAAMEILRSLWQDVPLAIATDEFLRSAASARGTGMDGIIDLLVRVPAWKGAHAPSLQEAPVRLLPLIATHRFSCPRLRMNIEDAARFTERYLEALRELTKMVRANRGSAAILAAYDAYCLCNPLPSDWTGSRWSAVSRAKAELETAFVSASLRAEDPVILDREGRKLRLGIVSDSFEKDHSVSRLMPAVARLDRTRFEVLVFTHSDPDTPLLQSLVRRGAEVLPLSANVDDHVQSLRDAFLDAVVFVSNPDVPSRSAAAACARRVAPVQLVFDGTGAPVAWPGANLALAAEDTWLETSETGDLTTALLPGAGLIGLTSDTENAAGEDLNRGEIGLSANDLVIVALGDLAQISHEVVQSWVHLLARVPESKLVICSSAKPALTPTQLQHLCASTESGMKAAGVNDGRLLVFPDVIDSFAGRLGFVSIADLVIDLGAGSDAVTALAAARKGIPLVAQAASSLQARQVSALLRRAGLDACVALTPTEVVERAAALMHDRTERTRAAAVLESATAGLLAIHDPFVVSEAFGRTLERAFDNVFRSTSGPRQAVSVISPRPNEELRLLLDEGLVLLESQAGIDAALRFRAALVASPADATIRQNLARSLCLEGDYDEATDLLLSGIELDVANPAMWHELAETALRASRPADAVAAIETALRLDQTRLDSWLLLADLVTDPDMAADIVAVLKQLGPEDERVRAVVARHAA